MKHCQYCAQTTTLLDEFGYCKKYNCFAKSGQDKILESLLRRCSNIYSLPTYSTLGITSYVTNYYNPRIREANNIMYDAKKSFGFVPFEIYLKIPTAYQKQWDKNIRW